MLAVFAGPFLVFGAGIGFFDLLQPVGSGPTAWIEEHQQQQRIPGTDELPARVAWFALALGFLMTEFAATALALGVVWRTSIARWRMPTLVGFVVLAAAYVVYLVSSHSQDHGLSKGIFRFTWDRLDGNPRLPDGFEAAVRGIIGTLNVMAVVAIAACWVAIATLVGPSCAVAARDRIACLGSRIRCGRLMLFTSSALLVLGVMHMSMWLKWGLAFVVDPEALQVGQRLVSMITGYWGLVFSAAVIAIVVPTMEWLRQSALRALREEPELAAREGLKDLLDLSPLQVLLRVATLLAPALIGRFGDVVDLF